MLLSPRYHFLFVHIAKTGGTSVRAALERYRWRDPWYWPMFFCARLSHLSGHRLALKLPRHAKIIVAKELLPQAYFTSLFKFAFVRNPWDLQVSSYYHIQRERPHYLNQCRSFEDFLYWKLDKTRPYQYHIDTVMGLQTDYLIDLQGNICVDFIGRYERLAEDFASIQARLGLPITPLPHRRQALTRHTDYRHYYNDHTAALIAEHFATDIARLNYHFDPQ
jgi:hypothetical protein